MALISKQAADAWDRILDAASALAELIETSDIRIGEEDLEELTIFLAANASAVRTLFKDLKRPWPPDGSDVRR